MKIEIKYGALIGAGVCAWVLAEFVLGFHNEHLAVGKITGYLSTLIPVVVLYRALKERRDQQPDGELGTAAGVKSGLVISAIAAVITTTFLWTYNHTINPGRMEKALEFEQAQMAKSGASAEVIARNVAAFHTLNSGGIQIITGFSSTLVMGLAISLIITAVLKKKTPGPG